jgi:hypothetical protein
MYQSPNARASILAGTETCDTTLRFVFFGCTSAFLSLVIASGPSDAPSEEASLPRLPRAVQF